MYIQKVYIHFEAQKLKYAGLDEEGRSATVLFVSICLALGDSIGKYFKGLPMSNLTVKGPL